MLTDFSSLAKDINIPTENLKKFVQDFELNIDSVINDKMQATPEFTKFVKEQKDFLSKYSSDLGKEKTPKDIAETISKPIEEVDDLINKEHKNLFDNGLYKASVSSYNIDRELGGDYQFVYDYFGKKTPLFQKDFIGYSDLYFYIIDMLEPFTDENQLNNWGIHRAAGIILYGPPGSGKIFWAKRIAKIIDYKFEEIRKSYLKTNFFNNEKSDFNDFLVSIMKQEKILLFLDDFDVIMEEKESQDGYAWELKETKNIIFHTIDKFEKEHILMIGAAKNVSDIDSEILAPGRFDVMIPIFPPNPQERAEMILYYMLQNLSEDATLLEVLKFNKADQLPFWRESANKMKAFSNTMIIDFTQSLKKRIRNLYLKKEVTTLKIDQTILDAALKEAAGKLTQEYLNSIHLFLQEVSINSEEEFYPRILTLQQELQFYIRKEEPVRSIGFNKDENPENNS
ncbi:ATP-binding protein [Soonwooa sp.]|uniref:ATP-binding protein n=2 Tax=Soonwooa sp. TaxID=1938592 RepID=UPI0028B159DF|nr:ATP-binding protein [Soonwooa sp.]